jgi:hypothetical protein
MIPSSVLDRVAEEFGVVELMPSKSLTLFSKKRISSQSDFDVRERFASIQHPGPLREQTYQLMARRVAAFNPLSKVHQSTALCINQFALPREPPDRFHHSGVSGKSFSIFLRISAPI